MEGDSGKSPLNKENQTNQECQETTPIPLHVHAESADGGWKCFSKTGNEELQQIKKTRAASLHKNVMNIDLLEEKEDEIEEEYEDQPVNIDDDSSSDCSSDSFEKLYERVKSEEKKRILRKNEEITVHRLLPLPRFCNDEPSLRLDPLPLKVLKNLYDVISKKPESVEKNIIFDPACRLTQCDAKKYFEKYVVEQTLKEDLFNKVAFSILHSRDYDLINLVELTRSPVALFEVKDEVGNFNTGLFAKSLLEAQLDVGVVHMDESVLSNHRVRDTSEKDVTNTKAIRWVLGNFDLPAEVMVAITPTHFKIEKMLKKKQDKRCGDSSSKEKSDISCSKTTEDKTPDEKLKPVSDASTTSVKSRGTKKSIKGPLFKMTKIVHGAFVEEIAPERIVEVRALAESIVQAKKELKEKKKKIMQELLSKSEFETLLNSIEKAEYDSLPALLKQVARELQRHRTIGGGTPNGRCAVCGIPPQEGDTQLPCTKSVLGSILKVLHTSEEGVLRAALKVTYHLNNKKLSEGDSLCLVKSVFSAWLNISNEIHAETTAALKMFFSQVAGRFPFAFGKLTWALTEAISQKQTSEKANEFKNFLSEVISKHLKSENADAWFKLADHVGSREARPPRVIVSENNGMILPLNDSQRVADDDPDSVAFWNNNGLRRRWGSGSKRAAPLTLEEKAKEINLSDEIKFNLNFCEVVEMMDCPDVFVVLESKLNMDTLCKLPHFDKWCATNGYDYVYNTWSRNSKSGPGYAGVCVFSKIKPQLVEFGLNTSDPNHEGRCITLHFATQVVVATYAQCSGYEVEKINLKKCFDKALKKYMFETSKRAHNKQLVLAGDLNVNPRECDYDRKAFEHMRRHKDENSSPYDPGCSPEEQQRYREICSTFDGINAFEKLHPFDKGQTWRHIGSDRYGKKEEGQRIDHFVTSRSLLEGGGSKIVRDVRVYRGLGSSDHWPMVMNYKRKKLSANDASDQLIKMGVYSKEYAPVLIESGGKRKEVNALSLPVFMLEFSKEKVKKGSQSCFLDTGCPFSIYNPDKGYTIEDDPLFKIFLTEEVFKGREVTLLGVGGGQVKTSKTLMFEFDMGSKHPRTEVLVLPKHEPTLPKLLLGMEALVDDFEGLHIFPGPEKASLVCTFDVNNSIHFSGFGAPKTCWRAKKSCKTLLLDQDLEEHDFESISAMLLSKQADRCCPALQDDEDQGQECVFLDTVVIRKCPLFTLSMSAEEDKWRSEVLVDEDANLSLINKEFFLNLKLPDKVLQKCTRPETAFGFTDKIIEFVEVFLYNEKGEKLTQPIRLHLMPDLRADVVLGRECNTFDSRVDWEAGLWTFAPKQSGLSLSCPFSYEDIEHYLPAFSPVLAKKDMVLPPRSQNRIHVTHDVCGTGYVVAPTQLNEPGLSPAWGICDEPEWVQVLNLTDSHVTIKKGDKVALLFELGSCKENPGFKVRNVDLDESPSEINRLKMSKVPSEIKLEVALARLLPRPCGSEEVSKNTSHPDRQIRCSTSSINKIDERFNSDKIEEEAATRAAKTNTPTKKHKVSVENISEPQETARNWNVSWNNGSLCALQSPRCELAMVVETDNVCAFAASKRSELAEVVQRDSVCVIPHTEDAKTAAQIIVADEKYKSLNIDLSQTTKDRSKFEVERLRAWSQRRMHTLSDGILDFKNRVEHKFNFEIVLTDTNPRFFARPDKSTPVQKNEIHKQVEHKKSQGIIERSSAPWSSNCVLINKNGKTRIAVDYRKLNSYTVRDSYLLPTVQEIMDTLANKKWFTSVDCVQAYHQIPIKSERDRDLTTFVVPGGGLYRYKYMPFGLKNAGACWSRFIDNALGDLRWNICCVYADDILIVTESEDVEDHIKDLDKVFDRLDSLGIKVRGDKMKLGVKELPFLGQIVGIEGIKPDPEKLKAIKDLPVPSTVHQLRRFLGMASYYRKFVKNFSDVAAPLYLLTKKNAQNRRLSNRQIAFTTEETQAFEKIKDLLTSEPIVLHFPDWGKDFIIHCDASDIGVGAVLYQKVGLDEKVVMYASKLLSTDEIKYQSYQKEALAMVWAIELFSHYVKGVPFTVVTDCRALLYLQNNPLNSRVARWVLRLQEYDFKIIHKSGARHVVPDMLSRQPINDTKPYQEEELEKLYNNTKPYGSIFEENTYIESSVLTVRTRSKTVTFPDLDRKISDDKKSDISFDGLDNKHSGEDESKSVSNKSHKKRKRVENALEQKALDEGADLIPEKDNVETPTRGFFGAFPDVMSGDEDVWRKEQANDLSIEELNTLQKRGVEFATQTSNKLLTRVTRASRRGRQREVDEIVETRRIYVPPTLRRFVLVTHHNLQMHGHQGGPRLKKMIGRSYYWPTLAKDAERHVASCLKCAKRKTVRLKGQGLIEPALATRPWEVVGIDLVGKCIESEKGNNWILTIVDHFTRYPIMIPLPDKSAETIAQAIYENLICEHGSPKKILSDRAKELIANSIRVLYDKWGVKLVTTGGYNPEANGACERFHRWLHSAITCTYDRKTRNWDDLLKPLQFAYRMSVSDVTGYSPYYLMHGREATLPLEACLQIDEQPLTEGYVKKFTEGLAKAFTIAREQQYKAYMTN